MSIVNIQAKISKHKTFLIIISAMLLFMSIGWILYTYFGHQLITAMYEGRSIGILNRIIERKDIHPIEFYFKYGDLALINFEYICFLLLFSTIMIKLTSRSKVGRFLSISFIYLLVAFLILHLFMLRWGFWGDDTRHGLNQIVTYTSHRPFVYRVLTPVLINLSSSFFPENIVESNKKWLTENSPIIKYENMKGFSFSNAHISLKYHLTYLYLFLCLVLLLFSLRYLTRLIYTLPRLVSDLSPAIGLLFLPLTFVGGGFFYDFPELLFMALCLICLIQQKWIFYYILFFLAILNKEANILLILFFIAFSLRKLPKRSMVKHLAAQIFFGGIIVIFLWYIFATNPGNVMEKHLRPNINFWSQPKSYFLFFDPYRLGLPIFPRGGNILSIIFVIFLVFYKWKEKPLPIKRLFVYTCVVNALLLIYACNTDEIRNLSFIFPSIYLLGVHSLYNLFRKDKQP